MTDSREVGTGGPDARPARTDPARAYWQRNRRFSAGLLTIWFVVTFVVAYFARDLAMTVFGWPLGFWVGAQGAILVYLAIVVAYARRMTRLDREFGLEDTD